MNQSVPLPRPVQSAFPSRNEQRPSPTVTLEDRHFIQQLVDELLTGSLVLADDWFALEEAQRDWVLAALDQNDLIDRLTQRNLLTEYQAGRVKAGTIYGLVLGNYRILDRVGAGGMGIVFKAEHTLLRRIVALKVLPVSRDQDTRMLRRFLAEMRAIASLQHPNIVAATDAGQIYPVEPNLPVLHYLVMEYVSGRDLEDIVACDGALDPANACELIHQIAGALSEAHTHNLVHRDIKPSNILVNSLHQAKLLDFGLARDFANQMTDPGSLLGTIDYMSPEQAQNPSTVDIRADIYGLGATLYWCLTGKLPFPAQSTLSQQIARRLREPPPSVRARRPEVPLELDAVISRMMAIQPDDRFQTPAAVMRALTPFLNPSKVHLESTVNPADAIWALADAEQNSKPKRRILIIDDDPNTIEFCSAVLSDEHMECDSADTAAKALEAVAVRSYDLVLLDVILPDMSGKELLPMLRDHPSARNARVLLMSGITPSDDLAKLLNSGADDFLAKPFGTSQLRARVHNSLRFNDALRRIDSLSTHSKALSHDLERTVEARQHEQRAARQALIQGLVALYLHRTNKSPVHLVRMQHDARILAEELAADPIYAGKLDEEFIRMLEQCVPLYDIGTIALPDHVLHKSGVLDPEERIIMQSHTTQGADLLQRVAETMGKAGEFLRMAMQVARSHHEQFNGKGYPDRLSEDQIPLAARIVAVVDSYEAMRSRRSYQPTLPHEAACEVILEASPGKYDPRVLEAFRRCSDKFETTYQQISD
jgi:response regulator RpfG family c-di-GMP phosphodiesterase